MLAKAQPTQSGLLGHPDTRSLLYLLGLEIFCLPPLPLPLQVPLSFNIVDSDPKRRAVSSLTSTTQTDIRALEEIGHSHATLSPFLTKFPAGNSSEELYGLGFVQHWKRKEEQIASLAALWRILRVLLFCHWARGAMKSTSPADHPHKRQSG